MSKFQALSTSVALVALVAIVGVIAIVVVGSLVARVVGPRVAVIGSLRVAGTWV